MLTVPGPPENITVLAFTMTQLKIGWQPPLKTNGVLKGYYIYNGEFLPTTPVNLGLRSHH